MLNVYHGAIGPGGPHRSVSITRSLHLRSSLGGRTRSDRLDLFCGAYCLQRANLRLCHGCSLKDQKRVLLGKIAWHYPFLGEYCAR